MPVPLCAEVLCDWLLNFIDMDFFLDPRVRYCFCTLLHSRECAHGRVTCHVTSGCVVASRHLLTPISPGLLMFELGLSSLIDLPDSTFFICPHAYVAFGHLKIKLPVRFALFLVYLHVLDGYLRLRFLCAARFAPKFESKTFCLLYLQLQFWY